MTAGFSRRDDPGDNSPECRERLIELDIDPATTPRNHFGRPRDVIDESKPIRMLLEPRIGPNERRQQGQGPAPSRRGAGPLHFKPAPPRCLSFLGLRTPCRLGLRPLATGEESAFFRHL